MDQAEACGDASFAGVDGGAGVVAARLQVRDELTGLVGRAALLAAIRAVTSAGSSVVVIVDVDHFSDLNARLGVAAGDAVLVAIANRLSSALRDGDCLARLDGDRFGVLGCIRGEREAHAVAERIARVLAEPVEVNGALLAIAASLGASWGSNSEHRAPLFAQAERALREAQHRGGRRLSFYTVDETVDPWHDEQLFATELRIGLSSGAIHVAYQPIVELSTGRVLKVEALARWDHPERGIVTPDQFIPVAEKSGLIDELSEWILHRACVDVVSMERDGIEVGLSVNVSPVQLLDRRITGRFARALAGSGLAPERVWLEITESTLADDATLLPLRRLHQLGVHLVIDDFGTGYANLQYLTRLPVDVLKIDKSFVAGLGVDPSDTAIVRSVVNLGRELGLHVVAEGVETESQRAQLLALNCRLGQGWLFSKALRYEQFIRSQRRVDTPTPPVPATDEAARVAALQACKVLDTSPEAVFDSLVKLASQLLATPIALISLVDSNRQWFKAAVGIEASETSRDIAFCSHAITNPLQPLVIGDTLTDARFSGNPFVTHAPNIRSYAGIPIRSREQLALGTLCVLDTRPRTFTTEQIALLTTLADQAAALLDFRRRTTELNEVIRTRPDPVEHITAQLGTALVEWTTDLVVVLASDATIRYVNSTARTMLGQTPADWIGRTGLDIVHPDDHAATKQAFTEHAQFKGPGTPQLIRLARSDGSWCTTKIVATNLLGVAGIDAIIINAHDMTPPPT